MAKLLLLSVLIAMIAIPVLGARAKSDRRGLRWTLLGLLAFNLLYLVAIRFIYPRLQ